MKLRYLLAGAAGVAILLLTTVFSPPSSDSGTPPVSPPSTARESSTTDNEAAARAFERRQSGLMMTVEGEVVRRLSDDNEGSRHQRFIIRLTADHTVLVAHNIDLARRVPATTGDSLKIRGQYEWNPQGGVIHWTHHDPAGRRAGGWIEHQGRRYR